MSVICVYINTYHNDLCAIFLKKKSDNNNNKNKSFVRINVDHFQTIVLNK